MTKEEFYTKWQPNGFYAHNPVEFMTDLESVIKTEQSLQAAVSGSLPLCNDCQGSGAVKVSDE